jgi:hypothetical protein
MAKPALKWDNELGGRLMAKKGNKSDETSKDEKKTSSRLMRLQEYEMNFDLMSKDALNSFQDDIAEFFDLKGKMVSLPISVETARAEVAHVVGDLGFAIAVPSPNQPEPSVSAEPSAEDSTNENADMAINAEEADPASDSNRRYIFGLNAEFEAHISIPDLRRFHMYNAVLADRYSCEFLTCIITMWPSKHKTLNSSCISFRPKIIRLYEWDEKNVMAEIQAKVDKKEKVNMLRLVYYPLCDKSARYYEKALEAFKVVSAVYLDRGERTRIASMIALGVLKFLTKEERKSLRRELEIMDIILDESILDLADEALQTKYETELKKKDEDLKAKDEDLKAKDEENKVLKLYIASSDPKTIAAKLGIALDRVTRILSATITI